MFSPPPDSAMNAGRRQAPGWARPRPRPVQGPGQGLRRVAPRLRPPEALSYEYETCHSPACTSASKFKPARCDDSRIPEIDTCSEFLGGFSASNWSDSDFVASLWHCLIWIYGYLQFWAGLVTVQYSSTLALCWGDNRGLQTNQNSIAWICRWNFLYFC